MFFHLSIGIWVGLSFAAFYQHASSIEALGLALLGIGAAFLPGIDFMIRFVQRRIQVGAWDWDLIFDDHFDLHRNLLHKPLLVIGVSFFAGCYMHSDAAGTMCGICTGLHLVYDSIFHGAGIAWFWPLPFRRPYLCYLSLNDQPARLHWLSKDDQRAILSQKNEATVWLDQALARQGFGILTLALSVLYFAPRWFMLF